MVIAGIWFRIENLGDYTPVEDIMSLLTKLRFPERVVLEQDYYVLTETHLQFLRNHPSTATVSVTPQTAAKYQGDFYGLLKHLNIGKNHYLILRMNQLYSPLDYHSEHLFLKIPESNTVERYMAIYRSVEN